MYRVSQYSFLDSMIDHAGNKLLACAPGNKRIRSSRVIRTFAISNTTMESNLWVPLHLLKT